MSLTGVTFSNQKVTPSDDGRLYSAMLSEGILTGCGITFAAATLSIAPGSLLIGGRELRTSGETLSITGATSGYARVLIDIDLTRAATKDSFEQAQWVIQYAASTDAFAALEQQDINTAGTHFQVVFCVLSLGSAGITAINSSMSYSAAKIADKTITAANMADDAVKLVFTNTSVAASAFVSSTTYTDFPYRAAVALSGVTAAMFPEVVFFAANAISGSFAPVSESYDGGVYIYAAEKPSAAVTIPTILCWR